MERNKKFLWGYTMTIFVVALAIILFASISLKSYKNEVTHHANLYKGAKETAEALSKENSDLSSKLSQLEQEVSTLTAMATQNQSTTENNENLLLSYKLMKEKKYEESREAFETVRKEELSESGQRLYNEIEKAIK